ncbi:MAG: 50S ribosomal protein L32 [Elusimicrobia bacterium]|jgi:ribosomal protein L32|nr:50S ribosomal protein L32 [Elusimicrobiota bacterium]
MPNPKRKHTRSRRDSRRSANWKLEAVPLSKDKDGRWHRPHTISADGYYNGVLVRPPKTKKKGAQPEGGEEGKQ